MALPTRIWIICIEATVRFAAELGYEVTVYSDEETHAALGPAPL